MGEEKENIQDLMQKIDELLNVLNVIAKDLTEVTKSIKTVIESKAVPIPIVPGSGKKRDIKNVKQSFSPELSSMLLFEETEKFIIVKPKRFLGSVNFAKIATIVQDIGGEYISAGKNSHFKLSKK